MSAADVEEIAASGGFVLVLGVYWLLAAQEGWRAAALRWRERRRAGVAERAAVEASLDDPAFAPEQIRAAVDDILAVASLPQGETPADAAGRPDEALIRRWAKSVEAAAGEVRLAREPRVDVLRVVNRPGELEDRVVLRVRLRFARVRPPVGGPYTLRVEEVWTLGRIGDLWTLRGIGGPRSAEPTLRRPLIPTEWSDEARLREQSLAEVGQMAAPTAGTKLDELIAADLPAGRKLTELSQVDGRFDPCLLDAVLRHLVDVWEDAGTGSSEPLRSLCCEEAASELLHPVPSHPALTFVLSGASLERWETTAVAGDTEPPRVTVELTITAVRFLANRANGGHTTGSRDARHRMKLCWTLGLFRTAHDPWRLLASSNPAAGIRGLAADSAAAPDDDRLHQERAALRASRLEHALRAEGQPPAVDEGGSHAAAGAAAPYRVRNAIATIRKALTRSA